MFTQTDTLSANSMGATTSSLVTTEKEFQLYVFEDSGAVDDVEVVLEVSPNGGIDWMQSIHVVLGVGYIKEDYLCTNIRARIRKPQSNVGQVKIIVVGR